MYLIQGIGDHITDVPQVKAFIYVHPTFSNLELDDGVLQYADLLD